MTRRLELVTEADLERVIGGVKMAHVSDWMISGVMTSPQSPQTRALPNGNHGGFVGILGLPGPALGGADDVNVGQPPPPPTDNPQGPQGGCGGEDPMGSEDPMGGGMPPETGCGIDPMGGAGGIDPSMMEYSAYY